MDEGRRVKGVGATDCLYFTSGLRVLSGALGFQPFAFSAILVRLRGTHSLQTPERAPSASITCSASRLYPSQRQIIDFSSISRLIGP